VIVNHLTADDLVNGIFARGLAGERCGGGDRATTVHELAGAIDGDLLRQLAGTNQAAYT
jgi:hypothetical protein